MTTRELGFLLIGLGFGLLLALVAILRVLLSLYRSAFIVEYGSDQVFVLPTHSKMPKKWWVPRGPLVKALGQDCQ